MTKAQQREQAIQRLTEFLTTKLPLVSDKLEIHADREHTRTGSQRFDLYVITKDYHICNLNYDIHEVLGTRMTKDGKLTSPAIGTDSAHDTVRSLERVLNFQSYSLRYVQH